MPDKSDKTVDIKLLNVSYFLFIVLKHKDAFNTLKMF